MCGVQWLVRALSAFTSTCDEAIGLPFKLPVDSTLEKRVLMDNNNPLASNPMKGGVHLPRAAIHII